jgi:hypothetical protein
VGKTGTGDARSKKPDVRKNNALRRCGAQRSSFQADARRVAFARPRAAGLRSSTAGYSFELPPSTLFG